MVPDIHNVMGLISMNVKQNSRERRRQHIDEEDEWRQWRMANSILLQVWSNTKSNNN